MLRKCMECILFVLILFSVIVALPSTVSACTCYFPSTEEALEMSSVAVYGKVLKKNNTSSEAFSQPGYFDVQVTLQPVIVFKGEKVQDFLVYTGGSDLSCGADFKENRYYLIYAYEYEEELHTSMCMTKNGLFGLYEALHLLGGYILWAILIGFVLIAGWLIKRRKT